MHTRPPFPILSSTEDEDEDESKDFNNDPMAGALQYTMPSLRSLVVFYNESFGMSS